MDDSDREIRIPRGHVAELSRFFAAHDRWLFGHACARTRGDRELAADLVQDAFEAAARAWTRLRGRTDDRQRAWPAESRDGRHRLRAGRGSGRPAAGLPPACRRASRAEAETGLRRHPLMFWLYRRMAGRSA
jgi:Sigma-70 region 2